jgi:Uma2 family endonuclease
MGRWAGRTQRPEAVAAQVKASGKRCYDEEAMSSQPTTFVSQEEYLAQERLAERKSKYYQGEVFAMSGASPRHVWIVANIVAEFRQQLKGKPCLVSASDLRLRVTPADLYTYPDVMVICGEAQFADDQKDTVLNPVLIVEVLSESIRNYDRGRKFQHYRKLPSLIEYLLIEQDEPHIEQLDPAAGKPLGFRRA